ncbi:Eukaryotic peptide chain release factor subunit 1, partial [Ophiophagus hannah]
MADDPSAADRNVEIWKIKKLIKSLEAARGDLALMCGPLVGGGLVGGGRRRRSNLAGWAEKRGRGSLMRGMPSPPSPKKKKIPPRRKKIKVKYRGTFPGSKLSGEGAWARRVVRAQREAVVPAFGYLVCEGVLLRRSHALHFGTWPICCLRL